MAAQLAQARAEGGDAALEQLAGLRVQRRERRRRASQPGLGRLEVEGRLRRVGLLAGRLEQSDDQHPGQRDDSGDDQQAAHRAIRWHIARVIPRS
jgi:hypothetical protein